MAPPKHYTLYQPYILISEYCIFTTSSLFKIALKTCSEVITRAIDVLFMVKEQKKGNMGIKNFDWGHRDLNPDLPMSVNI